MEHAEHKAESKGGRRAAVSKGRRVRRILTAFCVILALTALGFAVTSLYIRAPQIDLPDGQSGGDKPGVGRVGKATGGFLRHLDVGKEAETAGGNKPSVQDGERREGVYTILLIGTSDEYSADTIMTATVDTVGKSVNVISIPRDTKVEAVRGLKKINGSLGAGGVALLQKEVAGVLGFAPDFYVKIGLKGLIRLVDEIGGIDYNIPHAMNYDDPTQDLHIHFKPGLQHLDGQKSMELVRYRGYLGSDLRRMEVQQEFLQLVAQKVFSPGNIGKIGAFAEIYSENVETNLSVGNLIWFGLQGVEIGTENISMSTLPTYTADADVNPSYYQFVSSKEALALINETINPYQEEITEDDVSHVPFVAPVAEPEDRILAEVASEDTAVESEEAP